MNKKIQKIFLIITLIFGSLLLVSIRDVLAAPPVVTGVEDNTYYNVPVTITFDEAGGTVTATLNSLNISSGEVVAAEGSYVLIVTDGVDSTTINFWIDTTVPQVTGVTDGSYVNTSVTPTITDTSLYNATLNGVAYTSGTPITLENTYTLIVTDLATNVTTVNFTIDTTAPVVTGVEDGTYYKTSVSAVFTEGGATLNGAVYLSNAPISDEGPYELIVTDLAGNVTTINFTIDTTPPIITIAPYTTTPTNQDVTVNASVVGGTLNATSHTFTANGSFTFIATDLAGNQSETIITITNIDKEAPVVTGVEDGEYYNTTVSATFMEGSATLNGAVYLSNTSISAEGPYELIVTDLANNVTTINFTIDTTAPVVTGVEDGEYYNTTVSAVFTEGSATLNGAVYLSNSPISAEGPYELIVTDLAGNTTTINFVIDETPPVVIGVTNNSYYNNNRIITFNEGSASLNSVTFITGNTVSDDGIYILVVTDLAGNITTVNFVIDRTAPAVTGVEDGMYYNTNRIITFEEGTATLNGISFTSGETVSDEGLYELIVTSLAGNITTIHFTIDKTAPVVTGVEDGEYYNTTVSAVFTEGSATINGAVYVSNNPISAEGIFELVVTDLANNVTTINFTIDTTAPIIQGVSNNMYYNTNQTITFDEGSATLNSVSFDSGTIVSAENNYELVVTDLAGNITTVNFVIDKSVPIVSGIANNNYYNTNQTITFNEGSATLNSVSFDSGTIVSAENNYELVVTDLAGNITTVNFVIDKSVPIVSGIANNNYYNSNRTITFNEGSATLNGSAFTSGTIVSTENSYELIVTDLAGNVTTVNFVLDKTAPIITIAPYQSVLAVSSVTVSATVNEGSLNASSRLFTANGSYTFIATDLAGNVTERIITISNIGYTLNYSLVGTGGDLIAMVNSIMVNSGSLVIESRSIMFTATPAARHRVYAWRLDGNVVGDRSNTYLLNMLNRGMNVSVEFVLEGDLNNSNSVSITDLVILRRHLAGLETINDKAKVAADINASGGISITDLVILRRRLAGLE